VVKYEKNTWTGHCRGRDDLQIKEKGTSMKEAKPPEREGVLGKGATRD